MTFTSTDSVSKDEVENEDEAKNHRCNDDVGPVAPVSCDFLQPRGAHLECLSSIMDAFALLFHGVKFVLVVKHPGQVSSHLVSDSI